MQLYLAEIIEAGDSKNVDDLESGKLIEEFGIRIYLYALGGAGNLLAASR